jgi:hypothetical protein
MAPRARSVFAVALCATAALDACGGSRSQPPRSTPVTARILAIPDHAQAARLRLPVGRTSARYEITAPSPARYGFNVRTVAPVGVAFSVNVRTWYGAVLSIYDTADVGSGCRVTAGVRSCLGRFPLLPAQRAGAWSVVVSKRSSPAATVAVAVTFVKP